MPLNPVALSAALTPTVISTWLSHFLPRKSHEKKPTANLSYDEGIHIIRDFLSYSAKHPVEDLQAFTRQRVPSPHWVRTETVPIPLGHLSSAAADVIDQLGPKGISRVGGKEWWQWRGPSGDLKGEWVEMKRDYNERKQANTKCRRIILYIHGGAYSFGSIDTHRYQLQRHARKLKGRVFARLQDSLAAYHFLLAAHDPNEIIFAGDSAGGGMVLSMLVTIRDRGLPLPAGAILVSPWVDLTHSFPSILSHNPGDYLPPHGFRHKPSQAWPPPNADEIAAIRREAREQMKVSHPEDTTEKHAEGAIPGDRKSQRNAVQGYSLSHNGSAGQPAYPGEQGSPDPEDQAKMESISVCLDGRTIEVKDQIQMYATNQLIAHPLVSPVLQPSLGGLPPLFFLVGGGEMLRDEQFYVAHKAANPTAYAPSDAFLDEHDPERDLLRKYSPTYVQLQVWDNLCHVAPALSFTRPAKHMFRAIAQFGAWALARSQNTEIDILDDDDVSPIPSDADSPHPDPAEAAGEKKIEPSSVGRAGDPLPAFSKHMIRQWVDEDGNAYPLDPPSSYSVLQISPSLIGAINPHLVTKWVTAKNEWDEKFAKDKLRMQKQRIQELAHGLRDFNGESPPPSSLAARRAAPGVLAPEGKKSYPMFLWSLFASKHDKKTLGRENKAEGASRRRSVNAKRTGITDHPICAGHLDPKEQQEESVDQGLPSVGKEKDTGESGQGAHRTAPGDSHGSLPKVSVDKPMSPLLILPDFDDDVKHSVEENASTRALFHSPGTLPMSSQVSFSTSNRPTSWTVRSRSDDGSTIGDKDSLTVTSAGLDNVSTRAVLDASGVVGAVDRPDTASAPGDKDSLTVASAGLDDASTRAVVNASGVVGLVDRPGSPSPPESRGLVDPEVASSKCVNSTAEPEEKSISRTDMLHEEATTT